MKPMFIGGRWLPAHDGRSLPVVSPADGESFEQIPRGGARDVNLAVAAARTALHGP
jgi:aldehyde dehydrogenase (NAD+)